VKIDRRDALKKLAVGGVTAATASAVISSPVFGNDTPVPPGSPIVDASVDPLNSLTLIVKLSPGTATCNGNGSGVASVASSQITLSATPTPPGTVFTGNNDAVTGDASLFATFTKPANEAATAQINYFANYQCTYAAGSIVYQTLRTIRFETVGLGNDWSTSSTVDPPTAYDSVSSCTPTGWNSVCPPPPDR